MDTKSTKKKYLALLLIPVVLTIGFILRNAQEEIKIIQPEINSKRPEYGRLPVVASGPLFFDPVIFARATTQAEAVPAESDVKAIIVPHHFLAAEYMAGMYKRASGRQIDKIIIIGPAHFNQARMPLAAGRALWETPDGPLSSAHALTDKLIADLELTDEAAAFTDEHSVGAQASLITHYFPEAQITPVILNSYAGRKEAERLSGWLKKNADNKTLIVFSLDFSHYLESRDARVNDERTRALIEARDVDRVLKLDNDYVDSPVTLATALLLAEAQGWQSDFRYHGNSADFLIYEPVETTSYFGIGFHK